MNTELELEFMGEVYAGIINEGSVGSFSITVHLKKEVDMQALQKAAYELIEDCPYLSGRLTSDSKYELLPTELDVRFDKESDAFPAYYSNGDGRMLRVLYGSHHIRVEVTHVITDGRGLLAITKEIILRYFKKLGSEFNEIEIPTLTVEDAYEKFANDKSSIKKPKSKKIKAYKHSQKKNCAPRVITRNFSAKAIKNQAKKYDLTVSEYILAHIFMAMAVERNASGSKKSITATIPIDFRSFFETTTVRNFIGSSPPIEMVESEDFAEIGKEIKKYFAIFNQSYVQNQVNEFAFSRQQLNSSPKWMKKFVLNLVMKQMYKPITTMFTNLGVINFPQEIAPQIDYLAFKNSPISGLPYLFSCITFEDVLTLSITTTVEGEEILKELFKRLEQT